MNAADYQTLKFTHQGPVLVLSLDRPGHMNTVNARLHTELSTVFADIAADTTVKAVVLTGEGRAFSAGGDLTWFRDMTPEERDRLFREARKIIIDLLELPQPIIAAVNGAAAGLGATLALFCDIVYADERAKILDPHVRVGITAGDGGAIIWPWLVGPARAKQYLMTGDTVDAVEAERIGLVNKVVPRDQLLPTALGMAERLANGPQLAIRSTKACVNKFLRDSVNLILDTSLAVEKECFGTDDHRAAVAAFLAQKQ
ncbi:MAG: enoyl-CoA hydratase-related protein [Alphaproteobacteria bacterium]